MVLSKNQRYNKVIKVQLGVKTWLALAFCVWMIYQLRVHLNHTKQSSKYGLSVKVEDQSEKLNLGRKGLIPRDSEAMEEDKARNKPDALPLEEESEDLVEEADKGGDANDDDELETVRFDDPMDEIDSLNDDDGEDNASTDQHGEEEDDSPLEKKNADKVGT